MIASITQEENSVVTCLDETRHGFEDGDHVTFHEVQGMPALNACEPRKIKVCVCVCVCEVVVGMLELQNFPHTSESAYSTHMTRSHTAS